MSEKTKVNFPKSEKLLPENVKENETYDDFVKIRFEDLGKQKGKGN